MLDAVDRALIKATQQGLPLYPDPYGLIGAELGMSRDAVIERLQQLLDSGAIRRIGLIPNHYRLGVTANGMSVWDIADEAVASLGPKIGGLDFVTHCYRRPRPLPAWPYNVFAMVHGKDRAEVADKVAEIAAMAGPALRAHDILYSKRILKKTGLRIAA